MPSNMGLIVEFDRLILRQLARQSEELSRITNRLFINVSAASLEDKDYLQELRNILDGPLANFEVVLELTEQILLETRGCLAELHRRQGLIFAIDDFGTGFSSLQTVIELARHEASERIVRITSQMAHELQLETVAEMIETMEQRERIRELGIDLGQGYLMGIPDTVGMWLGKLNYLESKQSPDAPGFVY